MRILEVIESKQWRNMLTGQTASMYGAVPYFGSDQGNWCVETVGWTWRRSDGCIGLGRAPVKTKAEALEVMARVNALSAGGSQ